ncbi:MAG: SdiA-regulated domain-containing protein [Akkermansiaceae bacterium]|nr:SdiA-regulated domain-containing protein [Akkermansiaceae bacterium]
MKNTSLFHKPKFLGALSLTALLATCAEIPYDKIASSRHVGDFLQKKGLGALNPPTYGTGTFGRGRLNEPSGICWHAKRRTLFAVGDNGDIAEFRTDGSQVNFRHIPGANFEGITTIPSSGLLYGVTEGSDQIIEIHPETFATMRRFSIPRTYRGRTVMAAGGNGVEGITFIPDPRHPQGGIFCVSNQGGTGNPQDEKGIFFVEIPVRTGGASRIVGEIIPPVGDIAGLHYDQRSGRLYAISDHKNTFLEYAASRKLIRTAPLPGRDQEGIAFDDAGNMYLAQDSGGIIKRRKP